MCIIIAKDAGVKALDKEYFERAWDNNSHGGGLVWKNEGEDVYFQKGFMKKEDFLAKIAEVNKDTTSFIAHFRIKSVGEVKPENCHPFVMEKVTFAHNGTLSIHALDGMTDSETFGRAFLYDKDMAWIKEYKTLLEMALGTSKFAIMDNVTGEILILNKEYGEERDGAWFSNKSAFPKPVATTPATCYSGYNGYNSYRNYWNDDYIPGTCSYKPQANFGTKKFSIQAASYDKEQKVFVWNTSKKIWTPPKYKEPVSCDKRGLWKLNHTVEPSETLPDKDYAPGARELNIIASYQRTLDKMLNDYHKNSFKTLEDRTCDEEEISALNTVLNCMRRLVSAKKAITMDTMLDFCINNIQREPYANKLDATYEDSVLWYTEEIVELIEKVSATDAKTINDVVGEMNKDEHEDTVA